MRPGESRAADVDAEVGATESPKKPLQPSDQSTRQNVGQAGQPGDSRLGRDEQKNGGGRWKEVGVKGELTWLPPAARCLRLRSTSTLPVIRPRTRVASRLAPFRPAKAISVFSQRQAVLLGQSRVEGRSLACAKGGEELAVLLLLRCRPSSSPSAQQQPVLGPAACTRQRQSLLLQPTNGWVASDRASRARRGRTS